MPPRTPPSHKNGWAALGAVLLGALLLTGIFVLSSRPRTIQIAHTGAAIKTALNIAFTEPSEEVSARDDLNILVLGKTGPGHIAPDLTDTILTVHYRKKNQKVLVVSTPRDLLVQIPGSSVNTKINSLYQIGTKEENPLSLISRKVTNITGFTPDYFVVIDVTALEQVVDTLGGVNVEVIEDIDDTRFPTPSGGYEVFRLEKGWRYLNGKDATRYVRTRFTPRGDFDRVKRQQQVIEALRKKVLGLNPLTDFPKLIAVYETLSAHLHTNITIAEGKSLWNLMQAVPRERIEFISIEKVNGTPLITSGTANLGGTAASVLTPRTGLEDYSEIQQTIQTLLEN